MYEGSMVGAGAHVFALMGYVIANYRPDPVVGGQVRLNPTLLATIFGESETRMQSAIDYLCAADPNSTTPAEDGRRLVKIGQFDYRVVNAAKYLAIKNEEERREANRIRQANHRAASLKRKKLIPNGREVRYIKAQENDDVESSDKIAAEDLPEPEAPAL